MLPSKVVLLPYPQAEQAAKNTQDYIAAASVTKKKV